MTITIRPNTLFQLFVDFYQTSSHLTMYFTVSLFVFIIVLLVSLFRKMKYWERFFAAVSVGLMWPCLAMPILPICIYSVGRLLGEEEGWLDTYSPRDVK